MSGPFIKRKAKALANGEFRCEYCGCLLAKGDMQTGSFIEIKCRKCNRLNSFQRLKTA